MGLFSDNALLAGIAHGLTGLAGYGAVLALLSAVRINKGARVNLAMLALALGAVLLGTVGLTLALYDFQLGNLTQWNDLLTLAGALAVFTGALYWRRLISRLTK